MVASTTSTQSTQSSSTTPTTQAIGISVASIASAMAAQVYIAFLFREWGIVPFVPTPLKGRFVLFSQ